MERDDFCEPSAASARRAHPLDLTELSAVYDEASITLLLMQSLDHLDAQWADFDCCVASAQWRQAAEALHQVKGTFAFLCNDARALEPICAAETALRTARLTDYAPFLATARCALALYREALCEAMNARGARETRRQCPVRGS